MNPETKKHLHLLAGICLMILSTLACEPVIAIGWKEMLFVMIFVGILFGPPLYRFIRKVEEFLKHEKKNK
jgi:hypothetical protein